VDGEPLLEAGPLAIGLGGEGALGQPGGPLALKVGIFGDAFYHIHRHRFDVGLHHHAPARGEKLS
jgi:hypothetical protein